MKLKLGDIDGRLLFTNLIRTLLYLHEASSNVYSTVTLKYQAQWFRLAMARFGGELKEFGYFRRFKTRVIVSAIQTNAQI